MDDETTIYEATAGAEMDPTLSRAKLTAVSDGATTFPGSEDHAGTVLLDETGVTGVVPGGEEPEPEEHGSLAAAQARADEAGVGPLFETGTVYVIQVAEEFEIPEEDGMVATYWLDVATVTVAPRTRRDQVLTDWLETGEGGQYAPQRFGGTAPYRLLDVTAAEPLVVRASRSLGVER